MKKILYKTMVAATILMFSRDSCTFLYSETPKVEAINIDVIKKCESKLLEINL